ncbi:FHA domain-containing protein [Agrobacterium vitis]|uniref:FHA domain-containing protein n=1 Tax=Allorhizobium ampelinum TaxID=3025782 RepID=UPI001F1C7773|nr:FHA domain-containing protein [Allorhizobium ampelinum]MCF1472628.1 FHA domain-containing protein [Allorhizobium ampelinum]
MKLELRPEKPVTKGQTTWTLDYGRRTIGRAPACDWQVTDNECRVSKLHCTISRDRDGYILSDQSANGTLVDGKLLLEGDTIRLKHGASIDVRGYRFTVSITGEATPEAVDPDPTMPVSSETLTISSILADIAPNGTTARGLLGDRQVEEPWKQTRPSERGMSGGAIQSDRRADKEKSFTRHVDIGWSGPPQTDGMKPVLPDNWFDEDAGGSAMEHLAAPKTFVTIAPPVRRSPQELPPPQEERSKPQDEFDAVFADPEDQEPDARQSPSASDLQAERMMAALSRAQEALAESIAAFDLPGDAVPSLSPSGGTDLAARLEAFAGQQEAFAAILQTMMQAAGRSLDPRLLEAKVDANSPVRLPFLAERDYWAAYRQLFQAEGRILSFRDFMRRAAMGEQAEEPAVPVQADRVMGVETTDET